MLRHRGEDLRLRQEPLRRRPNRPLAVAALWILAIVPATAAWASFSSHAINNANSYSSGTLQLESTTPTSVNCFSTGSGSGGTVGVNNTVCPGSPLPSGELTTSTVLSATTTITSVGRSTATQGTVALLTCGVAEVADSSSSADTGLVYGGVTYGAAFTSPVNSAFTSTGIADTGATTSYVGTINSLTSPSTFTLVAWFKTSSTTGGSIIGFATNQTDATSASADRMLWVEPTGFLTFGVEEGTTMDELTSAAKVNNGAWHFVAASFSTAGLSLDIDGTTTTNSTITSANSYTGFWHLGWTQTTGWPNVTTDAYMTGSIYGASVFGTVLSSAKRTTLNDAASAAAYASDVTGLSPTEDWLLSDSGTTPYTGTIPALGTNQLCQRVLADIQATQGSTTSCVYPAGSGACPSTPTTALSSFTTSTGPLASSAPYTILIRMVLGSTSPQGVLDLHLLPDFAFTTALSSWSAKVSYPSSALQM